MVKSKLVLGMQEYLGDSLSKCDINPKVAYNPISVCIIHFFNTLKKKKKY